MRMKQVWKIIVMVAVMSAGADVLRAEGFADDFEAYRPRVLTRNVTGAFGAWRTVLMDGRSEIGPVAAGAVTGNDTQVLRFSTVATDRASAINDSLSFTGGVIELRFDFMIERSVGSNTFFFANSTDGANAAVSTTLFKLSTISQSSERYRIGTEADASRFSGTTEAQTLAYGQWHRFQASIDLEQGRFSWRILDQQGQPTRIGFDNLAVNEASPRALKSIWFGKIGAANDMAGAIDNIVIRPAPAAAE